MKATLLLGLGLVLTFSTSVRAIIGGETCSEDQFPASLALIKYFGNDYQVVCGATLIAPDVALTAAHCIENLNHDFQYYVSSKADLQNLKMDDFQPNSNWTNYIRAIATHGGFNSTQAPYHDIALLFLSHPSSATPAQLISAEEARRLQPATISHIVGWGQNTIGTKESVKTSPIKTCAETFVNDVTPFEMQLGSIIHSARKCFGDSGGATYVELESNTIGAPLIRMAGVTSHGKNHDWECHHGGYDTRIDPYLEWIEKAIKSYRAQ